MRSLGKTTSFFLFRRFYVSGAKKEQNINYEFYNNIIYVVFSNLNRDLKLSCVKLNFELLLQF